MLLEVPPWQAVLDGHDHGVRAVQQRHLRRHGRQMMRLQGQDHEVLLAGLLEAIDRVDLRLLLAAVLPDQLQAVLADGGEMRPLIDHGDVLAPERRSEEHTSELQSLMRISYAVFCLKKKK